MMSHKFKRFNSLLFISFAVLTISCSAQTEEQALRTLRELTREGRLPPESVVAGIESRFANTKTGALARLLRARIKFDSGDFAGAAVLLNSDVFSKRTKLIDHVLWLRGKALQSAGNHGEALKVLSKLLDDHRDSIRMRDAKLLWAESAIAAGRAADVPPFLADLLAEKNLDATLIVAKAYEAKGSRDEAVRFYRRANFLDPWSATANDAAARLKAMGVEISDQLPMGEERLLLAEAAFSSKKYAEAAIAYRDLIHDSPSMVTPAIRLRQLTSLANSGGAAYIRAAFDSLPAEAREREEGYRQLVLGYSKAKMWPQARAAMDEMRQKFPSSNLLVKTMIDAGLAAREAKNRTEEGYYLNTAVAAYPNAVEVAQAQFEAAWFQHEGKNYVLSSQMLVDHLARYAGKDTTNRGKAGYWAARDSERAGKTEDACLLYEAVIYRYSANWYGYMADKRLGAMKAQLKCVGRIRPLPTSHSPLANAIAHLRIVTVAAETARERELDRVEKSDELSIVGLFDWAIDELNEAKKTANNSPKINLALARHYRWKGDQVNALLSLAKSYPDYAQMFPEEMGREEWDIFYPLTHWGEITKWSQARGLDRYQVAGIIRQETIFDSRAKSHANAYGLMQLLLPTAKSMARKYGATMPNSAADLYNPSLNIELGTAYMKDQFDKFGQFEYVGIAYNAGPGRVGPWRAQLPPEIDEFVEAIPFKETKGYVQGIIRNTAQYRRLYDDNGNFKTNVGTKPLRGDIDAKPREQVLAANPELVIDDSRGE